MNGNTGSRQRADAHKRQGVTDRVRSALETLSARTPGVSLAGWTKSSLIAAVAVLLGTAMCLSLVFAGNNEPRLIIIGDSISTTHESWPNYLRAMAPRWNIQVMAQNGRSIRDFSIPRDLWTTGDKNETVIYFLGCNDILQRSDIMHARYRLQDDIKFLLDRNFKVLLIIPPHFGIDPEKFGKSTEEHRELMASYRETRPNLWVYDMDNVWDAQQTYDGVHPNAALSYEIALVINMVLSMNIY